MAEVGQGEKLKVFISYSRADSALAEELVVGLEFEGFEVTIDRHSIAAGEKWEERLGGLILGADTVVFVLSPDSAASPICKWEVEESQRLSKRIIPILARPVDFSTAPKGLSAINAVPFIDGKAISGLTTLVDALNSDLGWLREHTRLAERAEEWHTAGRSEERLLRGATLTQAKTWLQSKPKTAPDPTDLQRAFIAASEDAEAARENATRRSLEERERLLSAAEAAQRERDIVARRVVQRTRIGIAAALVLTIIAAGFGLYARGQRNVAEAQTQVAEAQTQVAEARKAQAEAESRRTREALDEALLTQSKYLAHLSRQVTEQDHDATTGLLLALEGLPDEHADDEDAKHRPFWLDAEVSLNRARRKMREQALLQGHSDIVKAVAVSRDGSRIVTGSSDGTVLVWETKTFAEVGELMAHAEVNCVAISPDGDRILVGSSDGAQVWDARTFRQRATLRQSGKVLSAAFTADGARFVTGSWGDAVKVWDANTFANLGALNAVGPVWSLAISPDGKRIFTGSAVWDAGTFAKLGELNGQHGVEVYGLALNPDGSRIVTSSSDGTARVWDANTFIELGQLNGHTGAVNAVSVSSDGSLIVTASSDKTVRVWDATTFAELGEFGGHSDRVLSLALSTDGRRIVTGSADRTARVWDATSLDKRNDLRRSNSGEEKEARFFGLPYEDDTSSAWHADNTAPEIHQLNVHSHVYAVAISPDGKLVTGFANGTARIWDSKSFAEMGVLKGHSSEIRGVAISRDGTRIVTGSGDRTARVWDTKSFLELGVLYGHDDGIESVAISEDGSRIASGSWDGTARVWDANNFTELGVLESHRAGNVNGVAFSADGTVIVTGQDQIARVWDAKTFSELGELRGHNGTVYSVAVSPDGMRIVTGSGDGTARIWDAKTFSELGALRGHGRAVSGIAFSADGNRIFTGSRDGSTRVWDSKTFVELEELWDSEKVDGLAVSLDGRHVFTASHNRTAVPEWRIFPSKQAAVDEAKALAPRCLTTAQRELYHLASKVPKWCETGQKWPYDFFTVANDNLRAGREREAIVAYNKLLALEPSVSPRVSPYIAIAHARIAISGLLDVVLHDKPAAGLNDVLFSAEQFVALAPNSSGAFEVRGHIYLLLGRLDDALADFNKAIAKYPRSVSAYFGRARYYDLRDNRDAAIADYQNVIKLKAGGDASSGLAAEYASYLNAQARDRLAALGAEVETPVYIPAYIETPNDFVVNVGDRVFFEADSAELDPQSRATLDKQAAWLRTYTRYNLTIEGHSDERGSNDYNAALAGRRAQSVRDYLISHGVDSSRIQTASYGKTRRTAVCNDISCWSQNRRAVTVLSHPSPPPPVPPHVAASELVGLWGFAAYHQAGDPQEIVDQARSQCVTPYVISQTAAGVSILGHDNPLPQDMTTKRTVDGKIYLGPPGNPASSDDREIITFDNRVLVLKWVNPELANRRGTEVLVRCGSEK
jgi:peptidoglycan-associated lipoprotein